jgi:3-deoxy-7-phosphoheptulonate synthase
MSERHKTRVDDVRIARLRPVLPPAILIEQLPLSPASESFVYSARREVGAILHGHDDRLLVVVGPCSIHDVDAAREYGERLATAQGRWSDALLLVMRVYFEKPRTTVGWKGLINDPRLDGTFRVNEGLTLARGLLIGLAERGVRAGCEFLDTITPQFIADTVSWGAIGARTTESQVHRELASGLSMPVGFKNGTDGSIQVAIDAVTAARHPHCFLSVTKQGLAAIVETLGNPDTHIILRGSNAGPNFDARSVSAACTSLAASGREPRLMIDCSHGNSGKDARRQLDVAADIGSRIAGGERSVFGVMVESHLREGRQTPGPRERLTYGQSVTDACIDWPTTEALLEGLADSVRARRRPAEPAARCVASP